jgi:hypothetical protein
MSALAPVRSLAGLINSAVANLADLSQAKFFHSSHHASVGCQPCLPETVMPVVYAERTHSDTNIKQSPAAASGHGIQQRITHTARWYTRCPT